MDVELKDPASEESRWVELALSGSEEGWRELHRLHYRGLWSTVNQIVRDEALAEDVVQEAFLKAYRKIKRFRRDSKFSTWLYRIAVNQAYDSLRKSSRRGKWLGLFSTEPEDGEGRVIEPVEERDASYKASLGDDRRALAAALDSLGPEHRAVVQLRLIQGFSTDETARILKCKRGTVLSRLYYSCQKMKKQLEKHRQDG